MNKRRRYLGHRRRTSARQKLRIKNLIRDMVTDVQIRNSRIESMTASVKAWGDQFEAAAQRDA